MSKQVNVTLCMITKNEEKTIHCCIASVQHLVDEIIVVDTGSTDHTVERALAVGAKVFHYTWQEDFSLARNFALAQATGDWILVLDADEILAYVSLEKFQGLLGNSQIEGYLFDIESCIGDGEEKIFDQVLRLFRNKKEYRFSGAIHEQVVGSIRMQNHGKGLGLANADFKIIHSGYLATRVKEKNKHVRNMAVIHQALAKNDTDPFLHYSLGMEYIQQGKIAEANEELQESLKGLRGDEGYFSSVLVNLASGLLQRGELQDGAELINNALLMLPKDSNLILLKAMATLYQKEYQASIEYFHQSVENMEDKTMVSSIHSLCGDIYTLLGYYEQAEKEYLTGLTGKPCHLYPLVQLVGLRQAGKCLGNWSKLSLFAPPAINRQLQQHLLTQKEFRLALVVSLLNISSVGSGDKIMNTLVCNDYLQMIVLQPVEEKEKQVLSYLRYSGEMMLLYAQGGDGNMTCPLLPMEEKIAGIANENLTVICKTLCPPWIPCLTLPTIP